MMHSCKSFMYEINGLIDLLSVDLNIGIWFIYHLKVAIKAYPIIAENQCLIILAHSE